MNLKGSGKTDINHNHYNGFTLKGSDRCFEEREHGSGRSH